MLHVIMCDADAINNCAYAEEDGVVLITRIKLNRWWQNKLLLIKYQKREFMVVFFFDCKFS